MAKSNSEHVAKSRAAWVKSGGALKQVRLSPEAVEMALEMGLFDRNFSAWVIQKIFQDHAWFHLRDGLSMLNSPSTERENDDARLQDPAERP